MAESIGLARSSTLPSSGCPFNDPDVAGRRQSFSQTSLSITAEPQPADGMNRKDLSTYFVKTLSPKVPKQVFSLTTQLRSLLLSSWLNILLLLVPVGFTVYYASMNAVAVFIINFLAIVALGGLLNLATRDMELRSGAKVSALMVITFGNAVNFVTSITALAKHQILLVQTSMIGALLSNILLMTGTSLLLGHVTLGYKPTPAYDRPLPYQDFNPTAVETMVSLLAVSSSSLIVPSAYDVFGAKPSPGISQLSRATALILLPVYASYMLFLLRTHRSLFEVEPRRVETRPVERGFTVKAIALMGARVAASPGGANAQAVSVCVPEDERPLPGLSSGMLATTLIIVTTLLGFCTAFAVDSVDGLTQKTGISQSFVGLILLPLLSNNMYAVKVARQGRLDLSLRITIDNGLQISLLVISLVILVGWIMDIEEMTLLFDKFQIAVTFLSILVLNYIIAQHNSNWLQGVLLIAVFLIVALASWFYPDIVLHPVD
ncbi:MAG: hypothetical protein M1830_002887 [Pleopsidium flavum]|nr:MAG: hypothetical protein M1830_002887 [Pleopsidium flavum]